MPTATCLPPIGADPAVPQPFLFPSPFFTSKSVEIQRDLNCDMQCFVPSQALLIAPWLKGLCVPTPGLTWGSTTTRTLSLAGHRLLQLSSEFSKYFYKWVSSDGETF